MGMKGDVSMLGDLRPVNNKIKALNSGQRQLSMKTSPSTPIVEYCISFLLILALVHVNPDLH